MIGDPLPLGPAREGRGVEVDEVDFAIRAEQRGEVQVVAVARPEDAEPAGPRARPRAEQFRDGAAVAGETAPLVAALGVETGLAALRVVHHGTAG